MFDRLLSEFETPFDGFATEVVVLRLLMAIVLGGLIGWERESRNKPAGLRTHILISLAASLFTLIAFGMISDVSPDEQSHVRADPLRVIEAVTAGVAFLAAGAIIQSRGSVHGLTTGAGMWLAGAIGVACGSGRLSLAMLVTLLALIVLRVLRWLERSAEKQEKRRE
ncbi:putative Mg2+ transporter-C (MgtC) family protein [Salinihabitans flavidus]|uniref:Protein MgtC n=2 Tax=Salinihabitans flavidus TaxID=569882 RepID=A0A1H8LBL1_9RHOB|nr:putative Mg2+ transporter-C (MgtC) family protein [Salinihabitans flavidus]